MNKVQYALTRKIQGLRQLMWDLEDEKTKLWIAPYRSIPKRFSESMIQVGINAIDKEIRILDEELKKLKNEKNWTN